MVRGASAPLTLFREYPGSCARAAGRFRPRRGLGGGPASRRRRPDRRCRRRGPRRGPEGTDAAGGGGGRRRDPAGGRARERARPGRAARATPSRVAVAMSGGVDSAVSLLRAGPDAVGVTLRLWLDPAGPDSDRACCSPSAVIAARETCHGLGLPHVTLDLREQFRRAVVTPFVRGYARGETPNPCIRCNGGFRFAELLAFRRRVGAARLSTGHYARIVEHGGRLLLARAADPLKDQSYMLARLDPRHLRHIWFPLGDQVKSETRAEADAGRPRSRTARREPGGVLPRRGRLPVVPGAAGLAPDERARSSTRRGRTLGTHDGFWRFTPGQRRGLGVSAATPLYALRTDSRTNTVVAGPGRRSRARASSARVACTARLPASRPSSATARPRSAPRSRRRPQDSGCARRARLRRGPWTGRRALRRRRRRRFRIGHVGPG